MCQRQCLKRLYQADIMDKSSENYISRSPNKLVMLKLAVLGLLNIGVLLLTALILYWLDKTTSYSVLLGGSVFVVANIYSVICTFRHNITRTEDAVILRDFYKGEAGKFILSLTGFAVIFTLAAPVNGFILFSTYFVLSLVQYMLALKLGF